MDNYFSWISQKIHIILIILFVFIFCIGSILSSQGLIGHAGPLGDFIGGLLNPLVSSGALVFLALTWRLQREELLATREELKRTREAHEAQLVRQGDQAELNSVVSSIRHVQSIGGSPIRISELGEILAVYCQNIINLNKMNNNDSLKRGVYEFSMDTEVNMSMRLFVVTFTEARMLCGAARINGWRGDILWELYMREFSDYCKWVFMLNIEVPHEFVHSDISMNNSLGVDEVFHFLKGRDDWWVNAKNIFEKKLKHGID